MRDHNGLVPKADYYSGKYVYANGPDVGQEPKSAIAFRRQVREYSTTHTPEEPFDAKPRATPVGKIVLQGSQYPSGPFPVLPRQFDFRREILDYYSEQEVENENHLYTREETTVHNCPPHYLKRQLQVYQVTHCTSPTQFYMLEVDMGDNTSRQPRRLPAWWHDMQKFYGADDAQYQLQFEGTPGIARVYVAWYSDLLCWERVRILKIDDKERSCYVFYLDLGIFGDILWKRFKELVPDWSQESPLALPGKLQHVYPAQLKNGKIFNSNSAEEVGKPSKVWSSTAVHFMKTYAEGKYFYGINLPDSPIYAITKQYTKHEILPKHKKFAMVLIDATLQSPNTLNAELCLNGDAICTGMGASTPMDFSICPDDAKTLCDIQADLKEVFDLSDDIKECFLALTIGIEERPAPYLKDINNIDEFFAWRLFGNLHTELEMLTTRIPTVIRRSANLCDITTIISPSCFYVLPASRISLVKELACYLSLEMDGPEDTRPLSLQMCWISVGMPIIIRKTFGKNPYFGREPSWYRAVISHAFWHLGTRGLVRAILLDFGVEVWADVSEVYDMPQIVRQIPALCFRAHLNIPNCTPAPDNCWSSAATEEFCGSQPEWLNGDPPYYIWESYPKNVVELDGFNQSLEHDPNELGIWKKLPVNSNVNNSSLRVFIPRPVQENLAAQAIGKHDLMITKRLNDQQDEEEIIVESEYTRLAPGCQIIQHTHQYIPPPIECADEVKEDMWHSIDHLPRPLKHYDTPEFEALCGPLFRSTGVNFSYELGSEDEDEEPEPETFELVKASDIFRENNHIKRKHRLNREKLLAEKGDPIRIAPEPEEKLPIIYKFVPNYNVNKY